MKKILLVVILFVSGCASVDIPEFKAHVTLPASGNGFWVKTVSGQEGEIPKEQWDKLKKRGIVILSEDWAILRNTLLKNCLSNDCKDAVGIFDNLFYSIDQALAKTRP